jgi:LEA14-like dessication related protein
MRYWFPPLTIALFSLLMAGCSKIQDPEFQRLEHFGVRKIDLEKATVGFSATYFNPNKFGVDAKEAEVDIYLDSVYLGKFNQEKVVAVEKNAEFSIPFSGQVSFRQFQSLDIKEFRNRSVLLSAEGSVKVGKAGIYITKNIRYTGRHQLTDLNLQP